MYICFAYTYTLILLLIGYSGCSDKPSNTQGSNSNEDNLPKIGGLSLVDYSDSEDEDNFQVTETTEEQIERIRETHETTEITEELDETSQTTEESTYEHTETHTEEITETEGQAEPVKDVETQTDLEQPEPQTESDDNQRKEKLHVLYYVPPPQEPYGTYQQIVAIPPIKPLPPPIPGESPKYYLISAEQNKYGEHETIPVTYMEYKPILQPVLYYEPTIGPQTYPLVQYPSVSYPVVIPPPIQPHKPRQETSQPATKGPTQQPPTQQQDQPNIRPPIKILRRRTQPEPSKEPTTKEPTTQPTKESKESKESSTEPTHPKDYKEPTQPSEESSSKEPTQPEEPTQLEPKEDTHEPTKTTKAAQSTKIETHETTQSTKEASEPTQTPQQEPSKQEFKEPTELEPETIPVEIGSDEEEEPTEPPKEPGDGDKPPDKPEEHGDEDEEPEDKEDKEPPKVVKICKEVKFMKKNSEGNLIPMIESDYEIKYENLYVTKYEFLANLEEIHCDGKPIFIHKPSSPYTKLITHNRCDDSFILLIGDNFVTLSLGKKRWRSLTYQIPNFIKLYKHDSEGNLVEMNREEYIIDFKLKHSFKYIMRKNISCIKVQVANLVAWEKTNNDTDLCGFSISSLNSVVLLFHKYSRVVTKKNGAYKLSFTKSKKK
uniref:Theileria-specific sub-telomeric protein, SVSP family member, putative n=1 Tax=Theileria annulata TaxID=5874 RepID=A0A3B0MZJ1_THEAN